MDNTYPFYYLNVDAGVRTYADKTVRYEKSTHKAVHRAIRTPPTFWQWLMGATAEWTIDTYYEGTFSFTYNPDGFE